MGGVEHARRARVLRGGRDTKGTFRLLLGSAARALAEEAERRGGWCVETRTVDGDVVVVYRPSDGRCGPVYKAMKVSKTVAGRRLWYPMVTLPGWAAAVLGVEAGDEVLIEVYGDRIVVRPAPRRRWNPGPYEVPAF